MAPNVVWLQKMALNICRKTHEPLSVGGHTKKRSSWSLWEKICRQTSHKNFSGKFGEIEAKILRTPKRLPAPTPMTGDIFESLSVARLAIYIYACYFFIVYLTHYIMIYVFFIMIFFILVSDRALKAVCSQGEIRNLLRNSFYTIRQWKALYVFEESVDWDLPNMIQLWA